MLEVSKDDDLAHRDDLPVTQGHHEFAPAPSRLEYGVPVLVEASTIFGARTQGGFADQRDRGSDLVTLNGA